MLLRDKKVGAEKKIEKVHGSGIHCLTQVLNLGNLVDVIPDTIASKYAVFLFK